MSNIFSNEASDVDLKVIDELKALGWIVGDTLLYRPRYKLSMDQQKDYGKAYIEPDIVLQDPISREILVVIENKLDDEKKAFSQLRIDSFTLKPRFMYACSKERKLFYDNEWRGLEAGEYKRVNSFLSYEDIKIKIEQAKKISSLKTIEIDTMIAGGYDPTVGKERYYQLDCINTIIEKYRAGQQKMLVHMATGLGKTRMTVALAKALLEYGLARKILFVVDRRILAEQALDDGFSLIKRSYTASRITTSNFRQCRHTPIQVIVIDTLEIIFSSIPSNFYDLIIVDECHRSISVNRKVVLEHFVCPKLGLTATPKSAIAKAGSELSEEDMAIYDTYKLFGCIDNEPDYKFDIEQGIKEGFLAPYDVLEIKTYLTKEAEDEGIPIEYVLDPDTRDKIQLPKEKKLKLEQLEKKYISEERCRRIAEEIRKNTQYGEKVLLFGVSQAHCMLLTNELNKVFNEEFAGGLRYAEAVISDNNDINKYVKGKFKQPYEKPYIVVSVDIMSTGVDIPCIRYISFAALTKSIGKYIQMLGRGTRLDPIKSGKFSFRILDFAGLCKRMGDNGTGTIKQNEVKVGKRSDGEGGGKNPPREFYIIDNPDPEEMIQRVFLLGNDFSIIDNIPLEEARRIFEEQVNNPQNNNVSSIKNMIIKDNEYIPSQDELDILENWAKGPNIYLDEGQLQRIYQYPQGSIWDFFLHALKIKLIPDVEERVRIAYVDYINTYNYTDAQINILAKIKDIIVSNLTSRRQININTLFDNPIYERIIGRKEDIDEVFSGRFEDTIDDLLSNLKIPNTYLKVK